MQVKPFHNPSGLPGFTANKEFPAHRSFPSQKPTPGVLLSSYRQTVLQPQFFIYPSDRYCNYYYRLEECQIAPI